jgi:osmotically-inducible protein OsmY
MNSRRKFHATLLLATLAAAPAMAAEPDFGPAAPLYQGSSTTVYGQRLTEDERINIEVVDRIARDDHVSGTIGVETAEREVTLNGLVNTPQQVDRAGLDAQHVEGIRTVHNYLRSRID